jgi:hypothetical protein
MERTVWSDERLDDSFTQLRQEMRDLRAEMHAEFRAIRAEMHEESRAIRRELFQMKLFMLGSNVTILAAVISLHG